MKKAIYFLIAVLGMAFSGCRQEFDDSVQSDMPLKYTVKVPEKSSFGGNTRAILKRGWEEGDKVYLFLNNLSETQLSYMTLTYNSSSQSWDVQVDQALEDCFKSKVGAENCYGGGFGFWGMNPVNPSDWTYSEYVNEWEEQMGTYSLSDSSILENYALYYSVNYQVTEDNEVLMYLELLGDYAYAQFCIDGIPDDLKTHEFTLQFGDPYGGIRSNGLYGIQFNITDSEENRYISGWFEDTDFGDPIPCQLINGDIYCWGKAYYNADGYNTVTLTDKTTGQDYVFHMNESRNVDSVEAILIHWSSFQ